ENPDTVLYDADGNPFIITDRFPIPILEYYVEHGGMWRLDYPGLGFNTQRLAIFGQVIEGMEIVDVISQMPTTGPEGSPANRPLEDTIITTITISRYNNWR
ncbi:MAG: peptidylprolyl isomerase, partial [Clostridiales bacterium]|nr:peptidylprolyl isomerase [Clostridiales bacterium]